MKNRSRILIGVLLSGMFWIVSPGPASAFTDTFNKGVQAYQDERFEESIELFQEVLARHPDNILCAFFLGLAFKQTEQYAEAEVYLRQAVSGDPRIREALVELAFVLFRQQSPEKMEEALARIDQAEKEGIYPARIAFLKGQIFQFQQKNAEAIAAFNRARSLDPLLTEAVNVQIELCEIQAENPDLALACFRASVFYDPRSDTVPVQGREMSAGDNVHPGKGDFRFSVGLYGRYDTNVLLKPLESNFAADISDEESPAAAFMIRSGWRPAKDGRWGIDLQHLIYGNFHEFHDESHDYLGNTLSLAPDITLGRHRISLETTYNHVLVRDPEYAVYHQSFRVGPLLRSRIARGHLLELFAGWEIRTYPQRVADPGNDRDGRGARSHLGWLWIPGRDSWMNVKISFAADNTDGRYVENDGYGMKCAGSFPVMDRLHIQLGAEGFFQQYRKKSPDPEIIDGFLYLHQRRREDQTLQAMASLTWNATPRFDLVAQYNRTWAHSTHAAHDYRRDLYTAGIEWNY